MMNDDKTRHKEDCPEPSVADKNIERLLHKAYRPEPPDPEFTAEMTERMVALAQTEAARRRSRAKRARPWLMITGAAALLAAGVGLGLLAGGFFAPGDEKSGGDLQKPFSSFTENGAEISSAFHLVARPIDADPEPERVKVGDTVETTAGQKRRLLLPDGSILYVNRNTHAVIEGDRQVRLGLGEVYLEVAPRKGRPFVLDTPDRRITALGTKFGARIGNKATSVLVLQGRVRVDAPGDAGRVVDAGQQLVAKKGAVGTVDTARRASYLLDWTRELAAAAQSPLVPKSKNLGGALMIIDPHGQKARLSLRAYGVDVYIEDGFVRTTIDQTYFNHMTSRQEGTFIFPLPPDAALSRLAMYVNGKLMEGGMAERQHARATYESIVRRMQDPALLEWVDGTTFKMRVFPLEPREEKRIVISYTQKLPMLYGKTTYRFPGGHNLGRIGQWSFKARVKAGAMFGWESPSHKMKGSARHGDLFLETSAKNVDPDADVVLHLRNAWFASADAERARFASAIHEKSKYLGLTFRPVLTARKKYARRDWVFLFESSAARNPLLARVQVEVVRAMLENAGHGDTFNIVTAATRARRFSEEPRAVDAAAVAEAAAFLETTHLVGAMDLQRALKVVGELLRKPAEPKREWNPVLVHLGSALATMGNQKADALLAMLPKGVPYVGVGVGKRWSRQFMKSAASRTGGYFTQINPDENVRWRAFDLLSTLNTPRLLDVKVTDPQGGAVFLAYTDSIAQGEELTAIARVGKDEALPASVVVAGMLDGEPFRREVPVASVKAGAGYLPRIWAKLRIDVLLKGDTKKNKSEIVTLSKAMYVMSPYTSLLVLENEAMYKRFKVDRGRKDHWALYPAPNKITVVRNPIVRPRSVAKKAKPGKTKPSVEQILRTIQVRIPPRMLRHPDVPYNGKNVPRTATAWDLLNGVYGVYGGYREYAPITSFTGVFLPHRIRVGANQVRKMKERLIRLKANIGGSLGSIPRPSREETVASLLRLGRLEREAFLVGSTSTAVPGFTRFTTTTEDVLIAGLTMLDNRVTPVVRLAPGFALSPRATFSLGWGGDRFGTNLSALRLRRRSARRIELGLGYEGFDAPLQLKSGFRSGTRGVPFFGDIPVFEGGLWGERMQGKIKIGDAALIRRDGRYRYRVPYVILAPGAVYEQGADFLKYRRPQFTYDWRIFSDLLHYAPGMNTRMADVLAVLEAEAAADPLAAPGAIDPAARKLIGRARAAGWRNATIRNAKGKALFTVAFDGTGRYRYDRTLPSGLRETVVCDGKTLASLYPELGLGGKRPFSRFHHRQFASLIPWALPTAEQLARGFDLKMAGERTVAFVPKGAAERKDKEGKVKPYFALHLLFGEDGRLIERRWMKMPEKTMVLRQTYGADGKVKTFDEEGKDIWTTNFSLKGGEAPDLGIDEKKLVVLSLPYRTRGHLMGTRGYKGSYESYSNDDSLALLATDMHQYPEVVRQIITRRFFGRGDRRIGFYTLLLATGQHWSRTKKQTIGGGKKVWMDHLKDHPKSELARYIADQLELIGKGKWDAKMSEPDATTQGFISRLARQRQLIADWAMGKANKGTNKARRAYRRRAFALARETQVPATAWALLSLGLQPYGGGDCYADGVDGLAGVVKKFDDTPSLRYFVRYEHARALRQAGRWKESRRAFAALYKKTLDRGVLPPIDEWMTYTFTRGTSAKPEMLARLMREASATIVKKYGRGMAVRHAGHLRRLGNTDLADDLFNALLAGMTDKDRLTTTLAATACLKRAGRPRPEALLANLLAKKKYAGRSDLWRWCLSIAAKQKRHAAALDYLERAIEIEYKRLPEAVNLQAFRAQFRDLMRRYERLAEAAATLEQKVPERFVARVVRAADRWRKIDSDSAEACNMAAAILETVGARQLAWDYLTTPLAAQAGASGPWMSAAAAFKKKGRFALADRVYEAAFKINPGNPRILWERATLLQQRGKAGAARAIYLRIIDGKWDAKYASVQANARRVVAGR